MFPLSSRSNALVHLIEITCVLAALAFGLSCISAIDAREPLCFTAFNSNVHTGTSAPLSFGAFHEPLSFAAFAADPSNEELRTFIEEPPPASAFAARQHRSSEPLRPTVQQTSAPCVTVYCPTDFACPHCNAMETLAPGDTELGVKVVKQPLAKMPPRVRQVGEQHGYPITALPSGFLAYGRATLQQLKAEVRKDLAERSPVQPVTQR